MQISFSFELISNITFPLFIFLSLTTCAQKQVLSIQEIVDKSIKAHGHEKFEKIHLEFIFRDYHYTLHRDTMQTIYSRQTVVDSLTIKDIYPTNGRLVRYVNEQPIELNDSIIDLYQSSLNAVMYFMELPYKLNDSPVIKELKSEKEIDGRKYYTFEVTFQGNDTHEDVYYYWIDKETYLIDYFAYSFLNDGGGTRFRKAINRRNINDVIFQDYENYRPEEKFVPLENLPDLLVDNQLILVSQVIKENISIH